VPFVAKKPGTVVLEDGYPGDDPDDGDAEEGRPARRSEPVAEVVTGSFIYSEVAYVGQ